MKLKFIARWNNIAYIWSNGMLDTLPGSFTDKISPKSPIKKLKLIAKDLYADFLKVFKSSEIPENKTWFLVLTQNNLDALKEIKKNTPNAIYTSFFRFRSTINEESTYYFYLRFKFFRNLLYPFYWVIYSLKYPSKAFRYCDLLLTVNGSYEESLRLLKKYKPQAIVFTNDHLVVARALLLAANDLGIKTYYVQHASVSEYFPPLEFTHAFLEGKDALLKYQKCGDVNSKVHLVGMSKFDKFIDKINQNTKIKVLGIAFNFIDKIEDVYSMCVNLKQNNSQLKLILRPHPGDNRDFEIFQGVVMSNPKEESAFEFLNGIDCVISGDSSIHLEAVLLNVYPLYFNFSETKRFDYYGYVKNNLIEHYSTIEEVNKKLIELQKTKQDIQYKATHYNAAIGSNFYGKTTQKISKIIIETLNNSNV